MGKKYIIEMKENERLYKAKLDAFNGPVIQEIAGAPYTEPDLEQVRKEAYDKGYEDCRYKIDLGKVKNDAFDDGYKCGLSDAWEAARKIWQSDNYLRIFKVPMRMDCFTKFSASEAIEKIRQYEQEQNKIIKGDIVRMKGATEIEIWVTDISDEDGGRLSGLALKSVRDNCEIGDTYAYREIHQFERTGRHYDVPTVLEKMREES